MKINLNDKTLESEIGKEIKIRKKTPLYIAVECNNIESIKLFLSSGEIDVNEQSFICLGNTLIHLKYPLHLAVEKEYVEMIKLLLENKKIDIDIKDDQGRKPIDCTTNDEIKQLFKR